MEMQFRPRNNDLGPYRPTFHERVNAMLPAHEGSAAPAINETPQQVTPHLLNNEEMQEALEQVELQTAQQGQEALAAHSGLNEQRVARLLGLLD